MYKMICYHNIVCCLGEWFRRQVETGSVSDVVVTCDSYIISYHLQMLYLHQVRDDRLV